MLNSARYTIIMDMIQIHTHTHNSIIINEDIIEVVSSNDFVTKYLLVYIHVYIIVCTSYYRNRYWYWNCSKHQTKEFHRRIFFGMCELCAGLTCIPAHIEPATVRAVRNLTNRSRHNLQLHTCSKSYFWYMTKSYIIIAIYVYIYIYQIFNQLSLI